MGAVRWCGASRDLTTSADRDARYAPADADAPTDGCASRNGDNRAHHGSAGDADTKAQADGYRNAQANAATDGYGYTCRCRDVHAGEIAVAYSPAKRDGRAQPIPRAEPIPRSESSRNA